MKFLRLCLLKCVGTLQSFSAIFEKENSFSVLHFPQQTAVKSDKYTYQIHIITSSIWN